MITKPILLAALILALATGPGQANLTVSNQVSPDQIWPATSARGPNFGTVTLTVAGEGPNRTMPIDVILAIDSSASMTETDPSEMRLDAARSFVVKMDPARDRVGLVSFDDDVDFSLPPTEEFARVLEAIGGVDADGGTSLDRGLGESIDLLAASSTAGSDERARFVIILSDGDGDYTRSGRSGSEADRAKNEGTVIYTIGLMVGGSSAEGSLTDMAETTGGRYFDACNASALEAIYQAIGEEVINLLGREVTVRYVLPPGVEAAGYSVPPEAENLEEREEGEEDEEDEGMVLTWELGDISAGEIWSTSFAVSSQTPGIFELGGSGAGSEVAFKRRSGFVDSLPIEGARLEVAELRSGASMKLDIPFNFSAAKEKIIPVHQVEMENDSVIVWRFSDYSCNCARDWAHLSDDGTIVVASLHPFSLSAKDALVEDLARVMDIMEASGANVSPYNRSEALNAALYYATEPGIYHAISYSFGADFDLVLAVPNCTVQEARFSVLGIELDYFGGVADQEYLIDGEFVTGCEFHDFPWNGNCTVEDAEITGLVTPGDHRISGRKITDPHTMIIEAITADDPEKEFFLYSEDYKSVWVPATTNALRSPAEMISITSGTLI